MMPPAYVKPYIRRQKNDVRRTRSAICEAVTRPSMRFVGVRSLENQGGVDASQGAGDVGHATHAASQCSCGGHLTEVGVIAPQGLRYARATWPS